MAKFLVYDLETTGLDSSVNAIIQFSGYIIENDSENKFSVLTKFDYNMAPRIDDVITDQALNLNKFTIDQIKKFPNDREIFQKFLKVLDSYIDKYNKTDKLILVGYNSLHFDQDFLKKWFEKNENKYFFGYFWSNSIDIFSEASRYLMHYRPALPNFKLPTVAAALDIDINNLTMHNSLYDATITLKIFVKLCHVKENILSWDDNMAISLFQKFNKSN